jgi:hypothetical protein
MTPADGCRIALDDDRPHGDPAGCFLAGVAGLLGAAPAATDADALAWAEALAAAAGGRLARPQASRPLARAQATAWGGGWLRGDLDAGALALHPAASWTGPRSWALRLGAALAMADAAGLNAHAMLPALGAGGTLGDGGFVLSDTGLALEVAELDWLALAAIVDGVRPLALDTLFAGALARAAEPGGPFRVAVRDRDLWEGVWAQAERQSDVAMLLHWVDPATRFAVAPPGAGGFTVRRSIPALDPFVVDDGTVRRLSAVCPWHAHAVAEAEAALHEPLRVAIQP